MELNLVQQRLEVANWIDTFYRKLRICLKHLQNTKDLRSRL